jgi:hypothetical protein
LFDATGTVLSGQFDWGDLLPKGNMFNVALPTGDGRKCIRLYAGTSENPALLVHASGQSKCAGCGQSAGKTRIAQAIRESSETARRTSQTSNEMMIQSVLYGDVERPAEMSGPLEPPDPSGKGATSRAIENERRGVTRRTEECKGTLSPVGNRASSVKV